MVKGAGLRALGLGFADRGLVRRDSMKQTLNRLCRDALQTHPERGQAQIL